MTNGAYVVCDLKGFRMVVDAGDRDISRQLIEHGWYRDEQFETEVFAAQLRPGMTVVDVGANIGFYTMLARSVVGESGHVIAVEPFPANAALIRASVRENGFANVTVIEAGAADRNGRASLYLSPNFDSEHSLVDLGHRAPVGGDFTLEVETVRLDDVLARTLGSCRADLIKIDVEGGETRAVAGMERIFAASPDLILMSEFWPQGFVRAGSTAQAYLAALARLGFQFTHIDIERHVLDASSEAEMNALVARNAAADYRHIPVMAGWQGGWYTNLLCRRG